MPRGVTLRTPERVAEAQRLRRAGHTLKDIGELLGIRHQTVYDWLTDPDGLAARERKRCYDLECVGCGGRVCGTTPGKMYNRAEPRCNRCAVEFHKIWTRETVISAIQGWADEHGGVPPSATDWNPNQAIKLGHPEKAEKFHADDCWPYVNSVRYVFGAWNAAIVAAGFEPRYLGKYGRDGEDPGLCEEIAAKYLAGMSTLQLADEYGVTASAINYRVRKAGVEIRSQVEAQAIRAHRELEAA